jgi:hypothetical protein
MWQEKVKNNVKKYDWKIMKINSVVGGNDAKHRGRECPHRTESG